MNNCKKYSQGRNRLLSYGKAGNSVFSKEASLFISIACCKSSPENRIDTLLHGQQIDWQYFKDIAAFHELAPFAYLALKRHESLIPRDFFTLLRNTYYYNIAHCQSLWQGFLCISAAFQKEKIRMVPIKGMALLYDVYAQYPVRAMVDIDILIEEKDILAAENILTVLGYEKELCGCKEQYWREQQIHLAFYKKKHSQSFIVELHWALDFKRKGRVILHDCLDRARTVNDNEKAINVLSYEDTLFSLALHARRFGKALCLKNAYDSLLLLDRYKDNFNWDCCLAVCARYELNSALYFLLCQIRILSEGIVPAYVFERLRVSKVKKSLIEHFIKRNTFSRDMGKAGKSMYLISHFLLYDTFSEPVKYIINIPQEQFAKYYSLEQYSRRALFFYRFRLVYILFSGLAKYFFKDEHPRYARASLTKNNTKDAKTTAVRAWGWSMYPNIIDNDLVLIKKGGFRVGDVVCFKSQADRHVMHRVIKLNKERVITRGDNSIKNDSPTALKDITAVAIAIKREGRLIPIKRSVLRVYTPFVFYVAILLRKAVKTVILRVQAVKYYPVFANYIFKKRRIEIDKPFEADDFYFIKARLNNRYAGYVKLSKKDNAILFLYVKIWYRHLGVEDKLREFGNSGIRNSGDRTLNSG
jgi:signal peptidase I